MPTSQSQSKSSRVDPDSSETRSVLQPAGNRVVPTLDRRNSLKKLAPRTPPPPPPPPPRAAAKSPSSPKLRSPRPPATKRLGSETNGLTSSSDRIHLPTPHKSGAGAAPPRVPTLERKKSKRLSSSAPHPETCVPALSRSYSSSMITEAPGSFAAVRREQVALQCAQRKMKIAHYGRSKSAKYESVTKKLVSPLMESLGSFKQSSTNIAPLENSNVNVEEKRCTFITPNSDPLYVAYHDEEWGVPAQDDKILFELLVLSGAQVGSDWTSILKKRQQFRNAFSEFDAEVVANLTEKQITSTSTEYGIDIAKTRGVVDNANRILEVKKEFGSFHKYIWGFVNNKPISPQYKFSHKIPVKTSKSESISKDMQRRGFRFVGPTVVHSFMQAAGLTNDHLVTCYRHLECASRAAESHIKC